MLFITPAGTTVLGWLAALCLGSYLLIRFLRYRLHHAKPSEADSRTKLAGANAFALSGSIHRLALCLALLSCVMAVNYTTFDVAPDFGIVIDEAFDEFDEVIPATKDFPLPPPPPPPPPVIEVADLPIDEPPQRFEDLSITAAASVAEPPQKKAAKPALLPPPLPPPPAPIEQAPVLFAERMPVFGENCKDLPTEAERKACSDRAILQFLSKQVVYPPLARNNGIQGRAVVSFTVERDGSISDIEILRDPGGGLGAEAERVIKLIDSKSDGFRPGSQQGRKVRVRFTVPILFTLN